MDMSDMVLEAAADVQKVMIDFMKELTEPEIKKQTRQMWTNLPDEMKTQFAKERPQEYAALKTILKGE